MKLARKLVTLAIVLAMVMAFMVPTAMAASTPSITITPNNDTDATDSLTITYKWYKILSADIGEDANVGTDGVASGGQVAYYVTNADQVTELNETGLFNVVEVPSEVKWYVELKDKDTTADAIVAAFSADSFNKTLFESEEFDKTTTESSAIADNIAAGYYYIESSLGTKVAVQTLSAVTIIEKNLYPTITKLNDQTLAGINDTVTYTVTVSIPETVAAKEIVLVDTITAGLTLNTAVEVSGAAAEPVYTTATFVHNAEENVYTLTIPAATVQANAGKTLTFTYTATVNENAKVLVDESNKVHLVYSGYTTVDTEAVKTKTLAFTVKKVDGGDKTTQLTGAEFSLWTAATGGTQINLVLVNETNNIYRVATAAEAAATGFVSAPVKTGTATIEGLNDANYYLQEDVAPTSYNKLDARVEFTASVDTSAEGEDLSVENNKGVVLPSTGGIGTTIFYVLGGVLFLGALVILFTNKRMRQN